MCKTGNKVDTQYGSCQYCVSDECAMIYDLYIIAEHRRKGHARQLIQKAIVSIRDSGYAYEISIKAEPQENSIDREKLILFYKSMGLKEVKEYDN